MENNKELLTQNLYSILGRKQVQLEAYQNLTQTLQERVKELEHKIEELQNNDNSGSN